MAVDEEVEDWPHMSQLLEAIGGFRVRRSCPERFGFRVSDEKVNGRGFLHAGVVATVADVAIGHRIAALTQAQDRPTDFVTIDLSCNYLGTARFGDWVEGEVTVSKIGRRIAAGSASFRLDRTIATATALFMPAGKSAV